MKCMWKEEKLYLGREKLRKFWNVQIKEVTCQVKLKSSEEGGGGKELFNHHTVCYSHILVTLPQG